MITISGLNALVGKQLGEQALILDSDYGGIKIY